MGDDLSLSLSLPPPFSKICENISSGVNLKTKNHTVQFTGENLLTTFPELGPVAVYF